MSYVLKQVGNTPNIPFHYFECDNESDLTDINVKEVEMGARCYVINSGKTYALNSLKQWKMVPISSGSGGGGSSSNVYDGGEEI